MIENFDKLTFERKVDILVAIHVFRMKNIIIEHVDWSYGDGNYFKVYIKDLMIENHIPSYSTLLTSTWNIVRKFDYINLFRSKDFNGGQWKCKLRQDIIGMTLGEKDSYYAWAETEQLAICYVGLKAVGFDVKGFLKEEGKV